MVTLVLFLGWLFENIFTFICLKFRYNVDSCDSLEPSFVEEKYSQFNIGINDNDEENSDILDDSPKKGSNRNKPFEINISFDQYRRNREYMGMKNLRYILWKKLNS